MIQDLINKILSATHPDNLCSPSEWITTYRNYVKMFHPDGVYGSNPQSHSVFLHLEKLKSIMLSGVECEDETGNYYIKDDKIEFVGNKTSTYFKKSYDVFSLIKAHAEREKSPLLNYIPKSVEVIDDKMIVVPTRRAVSGIGHKIEEKHLRWILNRYLEFSCYLNESGFVHMGLSPNSVLITPEDHGIQVISWYHTTPTYDRISTLNGKLKSWYTPDIFKNKLAKPEIDGRFSKYSTIAHALGCVSLDPENEIKLHTLDSKFTNILNSNSGSIFNQYFEYKKYIDSLGSREFYKLDL